MTAIAFLARAQRWWGPPQNASNAAARLRWRRGAVVGGGVGVLLQWWMLSGGRWAPLRWHRISDFYDAQARSWLHGHWDVDQKILGIEAFFRQGKAYMYQGPIPALLRLPVTYFNDTLDGRLTSMSMFFALCLATVFVVRLGWRLRRTVLGGAPVSRTEQGAAGALVFVAIGGSSLLFSSSRSWVYHEAIAWGVAFSLGSFDHLIAWLQQRRSRSLILVTTFTTLAILTRASVGAGPLVAPVLAGGAVLSGWLSLRLTAHTPRLARLLNRFAWAPDAEDERVTARGLACRLAVLGACVAVPLASYAAVNYVKFETLFSVPFERQKFTLVDTDRQRMLALNNGSLFSWKFMPTNLIQYWRPDMLGFSARWPFINFPQRPMLVIGSVQYDLLDKTAGVPAAMPVLCLLAVVGAMAIVRGGPDRRYVPLRVPLLAAAAGTASVLNIGYVANRYQSDFLPLLLVPALLGAPLVFRWARRRSRATRLTLAALLVVAAVFTVLANLSLAYVYQRAYGPLTHPEYLAGYVNRQLSVNDLLGEGHLDAVRRGATLPASGRFGELFILGDCDAVYWSDGMKTNNVKRSNWNGVERSVRGGAVDLSVIFQPQPPGTKEPLIATAGRNRSGILYVEHLGGGRIAIGYDGPGLTNVGVPGPVRYGTPVHVHGWLDPYVIDLGLFIEDRLYLATHYRGGTDMRFGVNAPGVPGIAPVFSGTITERPVETPVCRRLLPSAAPAGG